MENETRDYSIIEYMLLLLESESDNKINRTAKAGSDRSEENRRRQLEIALKIKTFIDEIPGGFLIYSAEKDERIIYANNALKRIFDCETNEEFMELTGGSFRGIVHPGDLDRVEEAIKNQISTSEDFFDYVEYRIVRKDGIVRWVEDFGHYVRTAAAGNYFYVFISDATEKVTRQMAETASIRMANEQKEKELKNLIQEYDRERKLIRQEHLQRLEVIEGLSINYDSILYANLDEDKVLPYRLSMRLVKQFDHKLQVRELNWFLDDYVKVWVHPEDKERVSEQLTMDFMREKLAETPTYYLNYRCIYKGETQYIQLRMVNVGRLDRVSQVVMGFRNVDEEMLIEHRQKQILEKALVAAKQADVAKTAFLSNMSHDMRTPLNAVFGYIKLAEKSLGDPEAIKTYLDKIAEASTHMLELTDKVLEFTYLETNDALLKISKYSIGDIAREACDAVLATARRNNITVTLDADSIDCDAVMCDGVRLQQAFVQLVGNAVKYNKPGGKVTVKLTEKPDNKREYSTFCFTVADTGIGIAPEYYEKIFEPFERANNTTNVGVFGTGLGLTIAKHFIEMMGGTIRVQSAVGKGSVFTASFRLKKANTDGCTQSTGGGLPVSFAGKKILLVEDNEINREVETEILGDLGFEIDSAENGKIAVQMLSDAPVGKYALVLMDIQMPVMDGYAATRAIRALPDRALADIPIIAVSANAFESDKLKSLSAGMNMHLAKPLNVDELVNAIKSVLK